MSRAKRERRTLRAQTRALCQRIIAGLRGRLKAEASAVLEQFPHHRRPCHTCAFNPATDGDAGFDTTVWGLAEAIVHDRPFYCHENLPKTANGEWVFDPAVARLCAGGVMLTDRRAAKRAILEALVERPVRDALVDGVGEFFPCLAGRRAVPGTTAAQVTAALPEQTRAVRGIG